jgi:hypothetical protein
VFCELVKFRLFVTEIEVLAKKRIGFDLLGPVEVAFLNLTLLDKCSFVCCYCFFLVCTAFQNN